MAIPMKEETYEQLDEIAKFVEFIEGIQNGEKH